MKEKIFVLGPPTCKSAFRSANRVDLVREGERGRVSGMTIFHARMRRESYSCPRLGLRLPRELGAPFERDKGAIGGSTFGAAIWKRQVTWTSPSRGGSWCRGVRTPER
ncbi:hypothetical protein KM043_010241 [Ampulex compressa]|nr:hypothetical protein KM043_010241 [Ampulex compressa]